jgi:sensor histidine kinase regulating citrate/malate metabolism
MDPLFFTVVIPIILFITVAIILLHLTVINNKLTSTLRAQEREYYFSQCQRMQEFVETTKAIRHDMKLHLMATRNFTSNNQSEEATAYLDSLLGDIGEFQIYSATGNVILDSLINYKLSSAQDENIDLDIRVYVPPELNIDVMDIVIILGNLLDNALDSVANIADKRVKLDIEFSRKSLFIKIENTFDGIVNYADGKNNESRYITTRKNGSEHGQGLKNIQRSVEKYDGQMNIYHTDNLFSVEVLLYVDDEPVANISSR